MSDEKAVMVSYNDLNKIVKLPGDSHGVTDVATLRSECKKLFKFGANVHLDIVFQKYDVDWDAFVDLTDDTELQHKDKLKMVVQPTLSDSLNSSVINDEAVSN